MKALLASKTAEMAYLRIGCVSLGACHRNVGAILGCLGALDGVLEASWGPLGGLLGASWGPLGGLLGALGASWAPLGSFLDIR